MVFPALPAAPRHWLWRPGSLTAGLRGLGQVNVRVMREQVQAVHADEAACLGVPAGTPAWVREVVLVVDGIDCVAARSLARLPASRGVWQAVRRLRTRPLADLLYGDSTVRRLPFACARLTPTVPLYQAAVRVLPGRPVEPLLARRSVFVRAGEPLLVAECFLPAFWNLLAAAKR